MYSTNCRSLERKREHLKSEGSSLPELVETYEDGFSGSTESFEDAYLRSSALTYSNVLRIDTAPEPQLLPVSFRLPIRVCAWSLPILVRG